MATPLTAATPGAYRVWPMDGAAALLGDWQLDRADPNRPEAVEIYFGLTPPTAGDPIEPPAAQVALQADIATTLTAIRRIFLDVDPPRPERFRFYYVRLFYLAQLGLEGAALPEAARLALTALVDELIGDEAGRVKNGHLVVLGTCVLKFAAPFAIAYFVLSLLIGSPAWTTWFGRFGIELPALRNFMLLWIGCFTGVWLSYGIRTTEFTIADLTVTDSDRLRPGMRLAFAGLLTMILGVAFVLGLVEVRLGGYAVTAIATNPMLAFVVGAFCGISELSLPGSVAKPAATFTGKVA